jgi:hypothetical protein
MTWGAIHSQLYLAEIALQEGEREQAPDGGLPEADEQVQEVILGRDAQGLTHVPWGLSAHSVPAYPNTFANAHQCTSNG